MSEKKDKIIASVKCGTIRTICTNCDTDNQQYIGTPGHASSPGRVRGDEHKYLQKSG